ncbi:ABC transporter permease [uncultured Microscilla sp.]|uniref:ABC transporter permease n=1 Tax=uncultured Microscilla sp. TaxID=432653 RepID=UPI002604AC76|nr:ABC transporter permease [uncultured Microscilla sp.]
MFISYLKTALRNLWRNKLHSAINLLGLTLGISCSFILWLYIQDELRYDTAFPEAQRIYRVVERNQTADQTARWLAYTSSALAKPAQSSFPEIEEVVQFVAGGQAVIKIGNQTFNDRLFQIATPNVLKVFDLKMLAGNAQTALTKPHLVVLTKSAALRLFGTVNAVGKTMEFNRFDKKVTVSGVIEDLPQNTHVRFSMLFSLPLNQPRWRKYLKQWRNRAAITYLLLKPHTNAQTLSKKLSALATAKGGNSWKTRSLFLQPLTDVHFHSSHIEVGFAATNKGNIFYVYAFTAVALFVLIIASINYINLTTAKSVYRAKEIGVRKVMGAYRQQLIVQFLIESSIIAMLAFIMSIGVTEAVLPYFNELAHKNFEIGWHSAAASLGQLFLITLAVGLLAGIYPALVLSGYQPVYVLKSQVKTSPRGLLLRKILVVGQFALSMLMVIATLIVHKQLDYVQNKKMGFNKEQLMVIDINSRKTRQSFRAIKQELLKHPTIQKVSATSRVPGDWKEITLLPVLGKGQTANEAQQSFLVGADQDFLSTFDIQLVAGANFGGNDQADSSKVLINQLAAKQFKLGVGDYVRSADTSRRFKAKVIGIVQDFHLQSLHNKMSPLIIAHWNNPVRRLDYFSIKVHSQDMAQVVAYAKKVNDKFDADTPLEYHFLDEQMKHFYHKEALTGQIFNIAAIITILIASMGLFGLATFTVQKRSKEIAIRKVLGASSVQLFALLVKGYIKQILLSFVVAFPVGYYVMRHWLDGFAYRTSIGLMVFVWAGSIALLITLVTIGYQTLAATQNNPVRSLRNE